MGLVIGWHGHVLARELVQLVAQLHARGATAALQHDRNERHNEGRRNGVVSEVASEAQAVDRRAHREASDDDSKVVQHSPHSQATECDALDHTKARLAHVAAVDAAKPQPQQLQDGQDDLVLYLDVLRRHVQLVDQLARQQVQCLVLAFHCAFCLVALRRGLVRGPIDVQGVRAFAGGSLEQQLGRRRRELKPCLQKVATGAAIGLQSICGGEARCERRQEQQGEGVSHQE
mmetsp:Transcript_2099/g.4724  ORF Transcript_2099/g.4724 Transcript_2099/m.4724 type:complete len:231 (+) Transcript_2099:210-902(+)